MKNIQFAKTAWLTLLFCFLTNFLTAQSAFDLKGRIIDQQTKEPLPYCSVVLFSSSDSSLVAGVLSTEDGNFLLPNITRQSYYLTVQSIGFKTDTISISGEHFIVNSPLTIPLTTQVNELLAVDVRGNSSPIDTRPDRQILRADKFMNAQGANAIDLIKNAPSITVDALGNISWRGSNAFLVLLNGKPVQTDPQQFLSQLPANSIDRIELITNPSARFDPDGKGGIINIISKRSASGTSFSGSIQGGLPSLDNHQNSRTPIRWGTDLAFNHRKGKWEFNAGANYLRNDMAGHRSGDVNTTIQSVFTSFPSEGERSFLRYSYTGRGAITFTPDSSNIWSVGVYAGNKIQSRRADIVYHNTQSLIYGNSLIREFTYFNSNVARKGSRIQLANLDYTHIFKNKSDITISGLIEKAALNGNTFNINLREPDRTYAFQTTENPSKNPLTAYRLNLDYSLPLKTGKLETGYQFRSQSQRGDFKYLNRDGTGDFEIIPEFSSQTKVENRIHSAYTQYSAQGNKLSYTGGLRYEYAERAFTAGSQDTRHLNLHNLFPSANIQYKFTPVLSAKAGYNRRVQRSTNHELNPFPEREHSETLESGDPDILPEFIDLTEAGVNLSPDWGTLTATIYNQRIKNVVNRVNSVYNDTIINRIYTNAGLAVSWGIDVSVNSNLTNWWQLFAGVNAYKYRITGSLFNESVNVNRSGPVYSVNTTNSFKLSPTLQLQWAVNYLSKRITAQGEDSRFLLSSLSARKTMMGGKLVATLQWQNLDLGLLNSNQQRISTWGKDFFTTTNYIHETDMILLNLSYSLNQLPKKNRLPKSEFGDREF